MADVTLAEANGQTWLVGGEEYIDDLLANTLAPAITIEIVACADRAAVWEIWETNLGGPQPGAMPWMINPAIVRRVKGTLSDQCIRFTPWSAMLDDSADALIAAASTWLGTHLAGRVMLRQFCPAEPPPGLADLQRLRGQLVNAAFARLGADVARLDQETALAQDPADTERLDLVAVTQAAIASG